MKITDFWNRFVLLLKRWSGVFHDESGLELDSYRPLTKIHYIWMHIIFQRQVREWCDVSQNLPMLYIRSMVTTHPAQLSQSLIGHYSKPSYPVSDWTLLLQAMLSSPWLDTSPAKFILFLVDHQHLQPKLLSNILMIEFATSGNAYYPWRLVPWCGVCCHCTRVQPGAGRTTATSALPGTPATSATR